MKLLLDECTPRVVKTRLSSHEVYTVQEMGWTGAKNGDLLRLAESQRFEALVTTDMNLRHQQNMSGRRLGVIVLPSNQVPVVVSLLPQIEKALTTLKPGMVVELQLPGAA